VRFRRFAAIGEFPLAFPEDLMAVRQLAWQLRNIVLLFAALGLSIPATQGQQALRVNSPESAQAAAAIRELEKPLGGHIPIIAMTAHALKGFRKRCLEVGMDAYVTKPVNGQDLYKTLESLAATC
jgi:CheY-like chemotaxis protein